LLLLLSNYALCVDAQDEMVDQQQKERAALIALGQATSSFGWVFKLGWLTEISHCDWDLVGCSNDGFVRALTLSFNNLTGELPDALGDLTNLQVLDLESNSIHGTIPASLGALSSLLQLGLGGNFFTGALPYSICDVPAIDGPACSVSGSNFTCPVPDCAAQCGAVCAPNAQQASKPLSKPLGIRMDSSLQHPSRSTQMAKEYVEERAVLDSLAEATGISGWRVKGGWLTNTPICDWDFVNCDSQGKIKLLTLGFNNLTGAIPDILAHLPKLQAIDFTLDKLEGPVPDVFGSLRHLLQFGVGGNFFNGTVPESVCDTTAANQSLCDTGFGNSFSCPLPTCIKGICKLKCEQPWLVV
jgi:hypothetical protein